MTGTAGQFLRKSSDADFDYAWADLPGGSSAPESTISGRSAGAGTGPLENLSAAQVKTILAYAVEQLEGIFISAPANGDLLVYDGVDVRWENRPPASLSANPAASVGLSAVNGVAATFMRSDAAPALSQAITPTWTGAHRFNASLGIGVNPAVALHVTTAIAQISQLDSSAVNGPYVTFQRSGVSFGDIGNGGSLGTGYTLDALGLDSRANPLQLGTASTRRFEISAGGEIGINCVPVAGIPFRVQESGFNDAGFEVERPDATTMRLFCYNRLADTYVDFGLYGVNGQAARVDRLTGDMTFPRAVVPQAGVSANNGTALLPAYSFSSDLDTGVYRIGVDNLGFTVGGVHQFGIDTTRVASELPFRSPSGSAGAPTYSFIGDTNSGLYSAGADILGFSVGGTLKATLDGSTFKVSDSVANGLIGLFAGATHAVRLGATATTALVEGVDSTGFTAFMPLQLNGSALDLQTAGVSRLAISAAALTATLPYLAPNGSAAAPALSFAGDPDSGWYSVAADVLGLVTGGARRVQVGSFGIRNDVDGTAAAPSYHWDSDPDTGLFSAGVNALGLAAGGFEGARVDATATVGNTRLMVYDVDNATLERVTVGAADSGGAGFKLLRIPN